MIRTYFVHFVVPFLMSPFYDNFLCLTHVYVVPFSLFFPFSSTSLLYDCIFILSYFLVYQIFEGRLLEWARGVCKLFLTFYRYLEWTCWCKFKLVHDVRKYIFPFTKQGGNNSNFSRCLVNSYGLSFILVCSEY